MSKFYENDLSVFFNTSDFADIASFQPVGKVARTFNVIFEKQFRFVQQGIESDVPAAICKTSDISDIEYSNLLTINSVNYKIEGKIDDGNGITTLILCAE